jgi:hypothetical protein
MFYRLYQSKEDVMIALYKLGTDELLEGCRPARKQEQDLLRQVERCICCRGRVGIAGAVSQKT